MKKLLMQAALLAGLASYAAASHAQCDVARPRGATATTAPLHVDGAYFRDVHGRAVMLRGMNVSGSGKVPPFTLLSDASQMTQLKAWGVNVVRLTFNWEAYEATRCQYDANYLAAFETTAQQAEAAGIYVLVDFHQDTFSRYANSGCGEGFPQWAIASWLTRYTPDNGPNCQFLIPGWWGVTAFLDPVYRATLDAFYADAEGIESRYVAMVGAVATAMARHANVIGYDLLNEPWGSADQVAALYDRTAAAVRAQHPGALLFYEPSADAAVVRPPRWTGADGQAHAYDNTVWAPHYYEFSANVLKDWLGATADGSLESQMSQATANGSGYFLGEMGEWATTAHVSAYMESLYDSMDRHLASGAQWAYTPLWTPVHLDGWDTEDFSVHAAGRLRSQLFHPRFFPRATAGTPLAFQTSATSFTYSWSNDPQSGSTEIFIPAGYATAQATVKVTPASLACAIDNPQGQQILRCSGPEAVGSSVAFSLPQPLVDGVVYRITNLYTGLAVDVADVSKKNGAQVHQWEYVGGLNQQWRAVDKGQGDWSFVSVNSGLCLAVKGDLSAKGQGIVQNTCSDAHAGQRIRLESLGGNAFHMIFAQSGSCLDDNNWTAINGAWLEQWPCASPVQANQEWLFQVVQ